MKRTRDVVRSSRGKRHGRSQGGMEGDSGGRASQRLTTYDALSYVREVKDAFQDQPENYNGFLEIMKDFKNQRIDRAGVMARAKKLFKGHNRLIQGFNNFLPEGCEIALEESPAKKKRVSLEEAVSFVLMVKECFRGQEHVFESFHYILHMYPRKKDISEIYSKVADLFEGHPHLVEAFTRFLPENFQHQDEVSSAST